MLCVRKQGVSTAAFAFSLIPLRSVGNHCSVLRRRLLVQLGLQHLNLVRGLHFLVINSPEGPIETHARPAADLEVQRK